MAGHEEFSQESSGHQQPTASQDISLFSDSAVPFPEPSLSPSISSFTHSICSQSILKQIDPIVSSDPAVEQIHVNVADLSSNTNLEGPVAYSDFNSSMSGSKEAPNSNVSCSFLQGAKAALNKLNQIGSSNSPNSQIPKSQNSVISKTSAASQAGRTPQHDFWSPSGRLSDLDWSSSESLFKPPIPLSTAVNSRTLGAPRALCKSALALLMLFVLLVLIKVCPKHRREGRLNALSLQVPPLPFNGSVHYLP